MNSIGNAASHSIHYYHAVLALKWLFVFIAGRDDEAMPVFRM